MIIISEIDQNTFVLDNLYENPPKNVISNLISKIAE